MKRLTLPALFKLARYGWLLLWLLVACRQAALPANPPAATPPPSTEQDVCCPTEIASTATPETTVFYPQPISDYLPNPGIGWQNTRSLPDRFPETVRYTRFNWDELQPAPDVFDWSPIEALRQEAKASGIRAPAQGRAPVWGRFHFRVRTTQPPPWGPGPTIPDWLLAQGAGVVETERGPETQYSSCLFLREHGKFIDALRQQYDGDPDLAFLDIGSYGYYGEWGTPQYDDTPESLDWHIRRHIADMYLGGSATRPCLEQDGSLGQISYEYAGFQRTRLLMPYNPWHEDALFYALSARGDVGIHGDVGIRFDALGSETHQQRFREKISEAVAQRWPTAPIVFELGAEAYTPEALASARFFAQEMHASLVHDNLGGRGSDADILALLAAVGYRLQLLRADFPAAAAVGAEIVVHLSWKNNGVAPPYDDFLLALALTNAGGDLLWQEVTDINARGWLPGEIMQTTAGISLPSNLPPGDYTLNVAFVAPGGEMPALTLANEGADAHGRTPLGSITIK